MLRSVDSSSLTNHCLPLVSVALGLNFLLDQSLQPNSFTLTAFLVFNYLFLTLIVSRMKNNETNVLMCVTFASIGFAFTSSYVLSLDCILCLTIWSFISNYCYVELFTRMSFHWRSSFSLGELLIVSQLSVSYLSTGTACLASQLIKSPKNNLFCSANTPNLVLQVLFVGIAAIVISLTLYRTAVASDRTIDVIAILLIISVTFFFLSNILKTNPLIWLTQFLFDHTRRSQLMVTWGLILALTILFAGTYSLVSTSNASTITRKLFHVCMTLVCVVGIKTDIQLLCFSTASLLVVFIFLEVLRVRNIPPIGRYIEMIFKKFRDQKDSGLFTLTHIYLLVGTCLPIWLTSSSGSHNMVAMISGVITVGIGDAAAAVGGTYWGRHKWKASKKTYEGTACAFVAQLCATWLINKYIEPSIAVNLSLVIICFISAVIEAKIQDTDNLILPLYHYILVNLFCYFQFL